MPGDIGPDFFVGAQGKQVFQSLVEPRKMIVDLELTPGFRQIL
jgi:hypothetical protein